jgi:iron complex outermembrane recepter protein
MNIIKLPFLGFIVIYFYSLLLYAQPGQKLQLPPLSKDSGRIMFRVVDASDEKQGIEFATAILYKAKDSTIHKTYVSKSFGGIIFNNIAFGQYYIKVVQVGYQTYLSNIIYLTANNNEVRLPRVLLSQDNKVLKTVKVEAEKADYQNSIDKKVYNVDKNITNLGGTATDVLQNIPSVTVDVDGKVSLRGSEQIRILIDGKLSGITAANPQAALQQLPASMIDQVEIITNPGAKYDAEGMGGIINFITKRGENRGWNINGQLSAGTNDKYGIGVGGNYRTGLINFSGNYNYRSENRFMRGNNTQEALNANVLSFNSNMDALNKNRSHNVRLNNDFFLDKNNTIGVGVSVNKRDEIRNEKTDFDQYDASIAKDSSYYIKNKSLDDNFTYEVNLDYKYNDNESKKNFSIGLNQSNIARNSDTRSYNLGSELNNTFFRSNIVDGNAYLTTIQMDYAQPLWKGKLDAGLKFTQRISEAIQGGDLYNFNTNIFSPDPSQRNDYDYTEQVPAAYMQYANSQNKLEWQIGLRLEQTNIIINNRTSDSTVRNNYLNYFPSGFIKYKLKPNSDVQLSYTRRINRPGIEALNPIIDNSDPLNVRVGNPYLKPELIHSLDLSYSALVKFFSFTSSVYYRHSTDLQNRFRSVDPNNPKVVRVQVTNFASSDNLGTELTMRLFLGKQGSLMLNANGFYNKINASNIESELQAAGYNWNTRMVANYKFKTNTNVQLTGFYMSPIIRPQGSFQGMNGVDLGIRQDLLKGKINIALNVTDIFDIREFKIINQTEQFKFTGLRKRESRIATLTLQWKMGSLEDREERRKGRRGNTDSPQPDMGDMGF